MAALTESLLDFISQLPSSTIPEPMKAMAITGFTDGVGVMLAGLNEPVVKALLDYVADQGGTAQARLLLGSARARSSDAAMVGATAAHALDFDDYAFHNHPSAVLVPAILAEADVTGATGDAMLRAYVAGYEVWAAVMKREPDHLHSKGWHPTAVFGALGVVAAVAVLRRLDRDTVRNALGLAVAHSGGVLGNFGSMTKPFQGGRAAQAGVASVYLAMAGLNAGPSAIDGEQGLLASLSPNGRADLDSPAAHLGTTWYGAAHGLNVKRYPTVGASQRIIDAVLQCRQDDNIDPAAVVQVVAHISEKHAAVMPFHLPQNAMEAKFSLEFSVAAALLAGRVGLAELTDEFVLRADVQQLMAAVTLDIGPDDDPVYPVGAKADWVEIVNSNGEKKTSKLVERAIGHGHNPMSTEQLQEKFMLCATASGHLDNDSAADLYYLLQNLATLDDVSALSLPG